MLTSEMVTHVRENGFDDLQEATILTLLNDAYFDVCGREPWPFLEQTAVVTTDPVSGQVTSPTDIQAVLSGANTANGQKLVPMRLDEFTDRYADRLGETGGARYYFNIASDIFLYPIPQSGSYVLRYIRVPDELTTSPDSLPLLPKMHHRVIILGALAKASIMEDDPDLASVYTNMFETRIAQMRSSLWMRQYDEVDTIQVVDHDDYMDFYGD